MYCRWAVSLRSDIVNQPIRSSIDSSSISANKGNRSILFQASVDLRPQIGVPRTSIYVGPGSANPCREVTVFHRIVGNAFACKCGRVEHTGGESSTSNTVSLRSGESPGGMLEPTPVPPRVANTRRPSPVESWIMRKSRRNRGLPKLREGKRPDRCEQDGRARATGQGHRLPSKDW